eukprot:3747686-Pyramimonas_sp.AAC.1
MKFPRQHTLLRRKTPRDTKYPRHGLSPRDTPSMMWRRKDQPQDDEDEEEEEEKDGGSRSNALRGRSRRRRRRRRSPWACVLTP